jgi:hypothetical protein
MSLHIDVPTRSEIVALLEARRPGCVSIYMPTTPVTSDVEAERIGFKNAIGEAMERVEELELGRGEDARIREPLEDLLGDEGFWAYQANSLATFATPDGIRTFRLPNHLERSVTVAERFYVKPLLRAVTFPQAAFVLALSQGAVRLLGISARSPVHEIAVADLPADAASAVGKATIADRSPRGAIQGSEGQKVRMRQYARMVDAALRPVLTGHELPLILAATQPLDAIYRSVNSYPHLAATSLRGNPDAVADGELADEARSVLDDIYAAELEDLGELFEERASRGRGATDVGDVARAATFGAVETAIVDIDSKLAGTIDEETGAVTPADNADDGGVIDEIARRVILSGGRVVAVREADVPHGGPVAAIFRFPV